jgi:hypothetical protein
MKLILQSGGVVADLVVSLAFLCQRGVHLLQLAAALAIHWAQLPVYELKES